MVKIKGDMSVMDMIVTMAEGNPGALGCMMAMIQKTDWYAGTDGILTILMLDSIGVYGSDIYMIWNDCCDRDLTKLELVLINFQMGNLTADEIKQNISQGRGTPFVGLKSLAELFGD